ncbi:hypothetical protein BRADO3633 [Bradyrhizobium sp. ORS 278]|uniref:head-tail connector protein n=1 Tax=Bradyrhizobium sp. (strain ORS 278) TaxID=114615 RepID=UPI0001508F45|nr:hypothetical protein [Bradyrhizobium sp. ORS 278]CAL77410.1 hypothetical protein BRADO3633 [Bradyrhizobium sp. ORS 278]
MLRITATTGPVPVSLAEAKAQLPASADDTTVTSLILAATLAAESETQRFFMKRTAEWVLPCWRRPLELPIAPVDKSAVLSIKYVDWTQAQVTLDPATYVVQTRGPTVRIMPKLGLVWPLVYLTSAEPIVIAFNAGYADAASVPENVKAAIKLTVRHLYSLGSQNPFLRRDSVIGVGEKHYQFDQFSAQALPQAASALLWSERWE